MTEQTFTISPTVIVRLSEEEGTVGVVTVGTGEEKALVVFRGPQDARSYQEHTGNHTLEEGHNLVGVGIEGLTAVLDKHGLGQVAMPEPWTGEGLVDFFTSENFIALLERSSRV